MLKRYLFVAVVVLFCARHAAAEWPSENAVITRGFGFNDRGRPSLGVFFESRDHVPAVREGEVVFSRSQRETASRLPSAFGAWTAVDHGDGLLSIYSRYSDEPGNPRPLFVGQGDPVARPGVSGWSSRNGFYFILYDRKERRWVNPSMVIALPAARLPLIQGIQLRNAQGGVVESGQFRNLSQGRYTVTVTAVHPPPGQFAPHRIICLVNGVETGTLLLETISARDGVLLVNRDGLVPASRVYAPYPAFEAGEFFLSRGQAILEIIIQDIAGNSRSTVTRIQVE